MGCPTPDTLQAYVEGHASADEQRDVRTHLEGCFACRDVVLAFAPSRPDSVGPTQSEHASPSPAERAQPDLAPAERADAVAAAEGEALIARAMKEEYLFNAGRLTILPVFAVGLGLLDTLVVRRLYGTRWLGLLIYLAWFVFAVVRFAVVRVRPSARRWVAASFFVVDTSFVFVFVYEVLAASPNPTAIAVFSLCIAAMLVPATQLLLPARLIIVVAAMLLVVVAAFFILAGEFRPFDTCALVLAGGAWFSILGQSRTRALLRRIFAEAQARAREVEAANVELRRQVAERSRDLSEALARLAGVQQPSPLVPGDVIEDRYHIVRRIGVGGMGRVYEVERLSDGRRLALKTMNGVVDRDALARFAREAQIAAELNAPNLVAALDVGVTRAGTLFLVMELVAGTSLAAARARYGEGRWAIAVLVQVARALAVMHGRGIVHRDLKPANILLDGERVKVADFGLAGLVEGAPLGETREVDSTISPALTRTGAILGTPLYMAPELAQGARNATPAADVFSLGVVAYELLSGKLPHAAAPVLERLSGRPVPSPAPLASTQPDLPTELCALVDGCLAEAPELRPTADFFAGALERVA
jgi:serine/threonine-protein kinase